MNACSNIQADVTETILEKCSEKYHSVEDNRPVDFFEDTRSEPDPKIGFKKKLTVVRSCLNYYAQCYIWKPLRTPSTKSHSRRLC